MSRMHHPVLTVVAAALLAALAFGAPGEEPEKLVKQGDELFRSGKFADAQQAYSAALESSAECYDAILRLGEIALLSNRFADAERHLQRAIELRPNEKRGKALLAEAYYRQDRFEQAATLSRQIGRDAVADTLASFKGLHPYRISGKGDTTRVKFVQTDPLPIIRARFNDNVEGLLVVDTGASELHLDRQLVEQLELPEFGSTTGMFAGGRTAQVGHGRLDALQLGDFTIRNLPVAVTDRRPPFGVPGEDPPVGVIGTVVFYHFITTLDYPNGELVLRRKTDAVRTEIDRQVKSPGTHAVPFWMADTHFMVAWGTVNGSSPMLMHADTGLAGGGFLCPQSTLDEAGIDISGLPSFQGMGGGGPVAVTPFEIERLTLGDVTASNLRSLFGGFPPDGEYRQGFRIGGVISHGFFRPYALTFDFERMRFYLTRGQ